MGGALGKEKKDENKLTVAGDDGDNKLPAGFDPRSPGPTRYDAEPHHPHIDTGVEGCTKLPAGLDPRSPGVHRVGGKVEGNLKQKQESENDLTQRPKEKKDG